MVFAAGARAVYVALKSKHNDGTTAERAEDRTPYRDSFRYCDRLERQPESQLHESLEVRLVDRVPVDAAKSALFNVVLYCRSSYIGLLKMLKASMRTWNRTLSVISVVLAKLRSTCQNDGRR